MNLERGREDIRATTIPLNECMNLHDPIHTSESVGSWPFHLVSLSSYVRCILDMGLDTCLKVVPKVVATLNQPRKKLSYKIVEMEYKWKPAPFDYVRCVF